MNDKQPKALWLAELLDGDTPMHCEQAAAELRRLHEVNAEMLRALTMVMDDASLARVKPVRLYIIDDETLETVSAAIAKATGEQQ
jgi:hypothetical protein